MKKSNIVSIVRYFILIVLKVKQHSGCSQCRKTEYEHRYFILIVLKVKQHSERSQRFPFNSSEVKQHSECSQ